jgi:hypothetical protein
MDGSVTSDSLDSGYLHRDRFVGHLSSPQSQSSSGTSEGTLSVSLTSNSNSNSHSASATSEGSTTTDSMLSAVAEERDDALGDFDLRLPHFNELEESASGITGSVRSLGSELSDMSMTVSTFEVFSF